ncbi:Cyclin_N domain-containing protein/Cyclin_C domain-containing protein, partial [Cephalotus follicularis]
PCSTKITKKKDSCTRSHEKGLSGSTLPASLSVTSGVHVPFKDAFSPGDDRTAGVAALPSESSVDAILIAPRSMDISPSSSVGGSVSLDQSMSTCNSLQSPEFEYVDNEDASVVTYIGRETNNSLYISEQAQTEGNVCESYIHMDMERVDNVLNVDDNVTDPQYCSTITCDIYKHLRASEEKRRPSTNYIERVQKDINASMRSILIDWLVEVAEEYRLVRETLFLAVNYIDRYLSGNVLNRRQLQLLGVACMMIAAKYEEICAPQVEEFCYITDNTYFKEELLQMESAVLNYLKFEMTAPTANCFLRRFVRASEGITKVPSMQLECLANYLAELSLLEYSMLCYAPSMIAASATFLAKYILSPKQNPWSSPMQHYTLYQPSDLRDCVEALHRLCSDSSSHSNLPAIREKYSQHKYKFVAKKWCPRSIPLEFFQNQSV